MNLSIYAHEKIQYAVDRILSQAKNLRITRTSSNDFLFEAIDEDGEVVMELGKFELFKKGNIIVDGMFKPLSMKVSVNE